MPPHRMDYSETLIAGSVRSEAPPEFSAEHSVVQHGAIQRDRGCKAEVEFLAEHRSDFINGTMTTTAKFFLAAAVVIVLVLVSGLMKLSENPIIRGTANLYIEIFRGTSLLVQLY